MNDLVRLLLNAPDDQMSVEIKNEIGKVWSSPPTVAEITHTRNSAAYSGACSDFVITVLNAMIKAAEASNQPASHQTEE